MDPRRSNTSRSTEVSSISIFILKGCLSAVCASYSAAVWFHRVPELTQINGININGRLSLQYHKSELGCQKVKSPQRPNCHRQAANRSFSTLFAFLFE